MRRLTCRDALHTLDTLEPRSLFDASLASVPREILDTVGDIRSVVTADLNGDGRADLAVSAGRDLIVLLRNSGGGYDAPITKNLGAAVGKLALVRNGSSLPGLASLGGRAGGGADRTYFRLLKNLGGGRFALADRDAILADPSFDGTVSAADVTGDGVDEVFVSTHTSGEPIDRLSWFTTTGNRLTARGLLASIPTAEGNLTSPVFTVNFSSLARSIIFARSRGTVTEIVSISFMASGAEAEQVIATRDGQIHSLLHIPDPLDGPGQLLISRTDVPPLAPFFRPGDAVVESLSADGTGEAAEIYRKSPDFSSFFSASTYDTRIITLLSATDMNGDGRLDIVAEDRTFAPGLARIDLPPLLYRSQTSLVQLIAQPVAEGVAPAYQAVITHDIGGRLGTTPLPAYNGPRYLIGDFGGSSAPDLLVSVNDSLRLANSNSSRKPPVVSRLETAPILIAAVGAFGFSANGVFDPDQVRGGHVDLVRCFRDSNHNGVLDTHDAILSVDTDGSDGWSFGGVMARRWGRNVTFFVQAQDNTGRVSAPVRIDYANPNAIVPLIVN